jgi:hypothetical protein
MDNFNPDEHMKTKSPLIFHICNDEKVKSFQYNLPFFYRIYNISAMKMHTARVLGLGQSGLRNPRFASASSRKQESERIKKIKKMDKRKYIIKDFLKIWIISIN